MGISYKLIAFRFFSNIKTSVFKKIIVKDLTNILVFVLGALKTLLKDFKLCLRLLSKMIN